MQIKKMHKNRKKKGVCMFMHGENDKFQGHYVLRVEINPGHTTYLGSGQNADSVLAIDVKQWVSPGP